MTDDLRSIADDFCERHGLTIVDAVMIEDPPGLFCYVPQDRVTGATAAIFVSPDGAIREFGSDVALAQEIARLRGGSDRLEDAVRYLLEYTTAELVDLAVGAHPRRRWWEFWK
jgi:hypothetical protein